MAKPAFKFNFRKSAAAVRTPERALPVGPPASANTAIVPAQPSAPQRFSFRNFGRRRKPANGSASMALQGAKSREIVRSDTRGETLGGIFAKSFKPGIGASVAGFLDESPASKALEVATDGMINLSDVALLGGIVARGAELDGKVPLVGTHLRGMNTAFITGGIASKFYMAGRAGGRKLWGTSDKSAKPSAKKSEEIVPGEATQA